jgi:hypothetical protein
MLLLLYMFKKLKKMSVFCIFLRSCDIFRDIPIFSADVTDKLHSGPSPILSPRRDIQHCFECFKLPFCKGIGQNINYLLISESILELHCAHLNPILYEVISDPMLLEPDRSLNQWTPKIGNRSKLEKMGKKTG